ncbi:MAG: HU family DNA-binding protein [Acidobacteria bacterium]|nr:HU family DNA-binding protein [Acidobacteriota bacterium]MCI0721227.1 HU family DNA-binding protein [Acidobacteriota bacterium]
MNKADLIERVVKDAAITKSQADTAISSLLSGIEADLKKGGRVTLVGFGTFSVSNRKARTGRNPRTGQPLKIAARKVAKFSPGAVLKAAVSRKK